MIKPGQFPRFPRAISRVAHSAPAIWLGVLVVYIAVDATFGDSVFSLVVSVAGVTCVIFVLVAELAHEGQLCVLCAKRIPLNAAKFHRIVQALLWTFHHRIWVCGIVLALIWGGIGVRFLIDYPRWAGTLTTYSYMVVFAWLAQAALVHRVHRPWCPYCRNWGDGGFPEPAPDPTVPEKSKLVR